MASRLSRSLFASAVGLMLVSAVAADASAQSPTVISGRVLRKTGEPISGATVSIEATTYTALSGSDGRYTLTVPASRTGPAVAIARSIGYRLMRLPVTLSGDRVTLDFSLTSAPVELTEVVVTALSQQREKATIGTAQQTVSAEQLGTQEPNLIQSMSGKVSGLQIANSGAMGGSSRIVIRGAGSILGNNQPLFIVDGVPVSNNSFATSSASGGRDYGTAISDINMDDVASLTVLKGPNAAALYGSRASNGAVVITTKGAHNLLNGTQVSFTSRETADQMSIFPSYQNGYGQGFGGEFNYVDGAGSGTNDGADESWGPKLDGRTHGCIFVAGSPTPAVGASSPYDQTKGCDQFNGLAQPWIAHPNNVRDFFRTGSTISNNINVSNSNDAGGARLSVTKDETRGIVPNSSLSKLGGTLSANTIIRERLTLGGSLQYVSTNGMNRPEEGYTEGNPFMTFTWFGRQVDVDALKTKFYNDASSPYGFPVGSLYNWNDNYHRNPWWQYAKNPSPDSRDRVIAQVNANYQFAPWLSGLIRAGGDNYRNTTQQDFAAGNIDNASPSYNGGFTHNMDRARESNFEGILTATHSTDMFDITANLGGNRRRNDSYSEAYNTRGILIPEIYNLSNAAIPATSTNFESHQAVNSSYGSLVVTTDKVFTLELTGRNDWSSTLPKANSSYFYPSVTGSLLLSDLFPSITNTPLSYLKLRGSWARVGSDAGPYQLKTVYSGNSSKFAGLPQFTLNDASANPNLKPEQTTGTEGGFELAMFNDRVTMDATYYQKITRNQIINLTVTPTSGFTSTVVNAGQMSNKGIEATVGAKVLHLANGFTWNTTLNWLRNRNMVDALAPGLTSTTIASQWGSQIRAMVGQPYGVLWGKAWVRDSATGEVKTSGGLPIGAGSASILGNVNPDWTGGWSNEFRYKRWSLSSLLDVRHGGKNFSIGNWWGMYAGILSSTLKGREVDWNNPGLLVHGIDATTGKENTIRVTAEDYGHNLYPTVEPAVFNSGFAKLREVRLGYDVPGQYIKRLNLTQMNVSLVGRNLMTWTSFPNYDPENATSAGNGGQGYDMGAMPSTRNFGINFTITP